MCYMNAQKERGSDPENFGTRITRFGVVVEKIWIFEVLELFLWIFLRLGLKASVSGIEEGGYEG
jgi:hypothetical protein